jgi:hypothetical protein
VGELVAGRDCGDCMVCCTVPAVDNPDIQKRAATRCRHCSGGSGARCGIYDTRPKVCREFYCGWRRMPAWGDEWRPDKSHIFTFMETVETPVGLQQALTLMLTGNPLMTVRQSRVIDFIRAGILSGLPIYLSLPSPAGHSPHRVLLNTHERFAAAQHSAGQVKQYLELAVKFMAAQPFPPYPMRHSGNDVSLETEASFTEA